VKPVVIVGAGLSGLAAGVALASRGVFVRILEQRPHAGGRAYSFRDRTTGDMIDNGQHLLIAGYVRTRAYLETIGSAHLLEIQRTPELVFHHPRRGLLRFRIPALPSPLHLIAGVMASDLFGIGDKFGVLRAGASLARACGTGAGVPGTWTVEQWLDRERASPEARTRFWHPLAVSIMNERPETASARVFLRSLREAFFSHPAGAALAVPRVGLSELLVNPAEAYIRARGGDVRVGADVAELLEGRSGVTGVRTRDGVVHGASSVILAGPSSAAARLMPSSCREGFHLRDISAAAASPILCIHLWYKHAVSPHAVLGVLGRKVQWVFRHARVHTAGSAEGERLSLVISAGYEEAGLKNEALINAGIEDCVAIFGEVARRPYHAVVIREKRATFSLSPSVEAERPAAQTPVSNLFLAGDWTATGLPATVEGAIRSGEAAAWLATHMVSD
jgi:zeta-carotene desaturase